MDKKILYVVIAEPINIDRFYLICAICDNRKLAESICEDVYLSDCIDNKYRCVKVEEYPLNCFVAW